MSYDTLTNQFSRTYRFESASDAESGDPITQEQFDVALDDLSEGLNEALRRGVILPTSVDIASSNLSYARFSVGDILIIGRDAFEVAESDTSKPNIETQAGLKLIEAGNSFTSLDHAQFGTTLGARSISIAGDPYSESEQDISDITTSDGRSWRKVHRSESSRITKIYEASELTNPLDLSLKFDALGTIDVYVDGVYQNEGDFLLTGSDLVFFNEWPANVNQVSVVMWTSIDFKNILTILDAGEF